MATEPTEAQIQAFGEKLQAFAATLTLEEQTILESIIRLAIGAEGEGPQDEVQGYDAASVQRPQPTTQPSGSQLKLMAEILSNVSKTRSEISMTFARNARA
jgi:hypothetical protein